MFAFPPASGCFAAAAPAAGCARGAVEPGPTVDLPGAALVGPTLGLTPTGLLGRASPPTLAYPGRADILAPAAPAAPAAPTGSFLVYLRISFYDSIAYNFL